MKFILVYIIILCIQIPGFSQSFPDLKFSHLSEKDGLSSNNVNAVTQDGDGIIWAATENGLNRFDGYGFENFYANPYDLSSIVANNISNMYSDKQNHLWLMTTAGICRFNTVTQKTTRFVSGTDSPAAFQVFDGSAIWFDKDPSHPYLVSPSALYHFKNDTAARPVDIDFPSFNYKSFSFHSFIKIVEDKKGGLWGFIHNKIFSLYKDSKKIKAAIDCPDQDISVYDILFDQKNRCWVSTWANGLYWFRPGENVWHKFPLKDRISPIMKNGVEWKWNRKTFIVFSTGKPLLLMIDEASLQTREYNIIGQTGSINAPIVDRQDILWVPTTDGIYYYTLSNNLFTIRPVTTPAGKGKYAFANLCTVYDMREEPSGYWISRRYDGGILWYSKDWKLVKYWPEVVEGSGAAFDSRLSTTREGFDFKQVGDLMFVTTEWGMVTIDLHNFQKRIYQYPLTKPIMRLRTIVAENDHKWWIRSYDQGVFIFNPQNKQFIKHYNPGATCEGCSPPSANYLVQDQKGRVLESTDEGLFEYDLRKDSFLRVYTRSKLVLGTSLMGMDVDSSGIIWIGSDNGIVGYDPDSKKVVKSVTENNSIGQVQRVTIDHEQNVWFNSIAGYWCWVRKRDKVIQFKYSQGLSYHYDNGLFYTTPNGEVYAGGVGALIRFFPDRLMNYRITAKTKIVEVLINDHLILPQENKKGVKQLNLQPDENNLRVHFDVINYDQPDNNLFFYKLSPGKEEWKQIENGKLSFNNLPAGDYRLTVKGGNKLTGRFTNTDLLVWSIQPKWFQSLWFVLFCIVSGCFTIFFIVMRRIKNIRREAGFKQKIAETEMLALRSQMNPHFIFNSLNGIEYFILHNEKRNASVYLNKFASLIRIILSSSREDIVPFAEDLSTIKLYVDLELLRCNYGFQYISDIDPSLFDQDYRVPPLLIQPFVENAIVHGFAYSDRTDLQLIVSAELQENYIKYMIIDNGAGRKKTSAYNEVNRPHHKSLGLQITQERINIFNEQHQANSSVVIEDLYNYENKPDGTKVTLMIKLI